MWMTTDINGLGAVYMTGLKRWTLFFIRRSQGSCYLTLNPLSITRAFFWNGCIVKSHGAPGARKIFTAESEVLQREKVKAESAALKDALSKCRLNLMTWSPDYAELSREWLLEIFNYLWYLGHFLY